MKAALLVALLPALLPVWAWAQAEPPQEAQLRAAFVYRFAQFTQWPAPLQAGLTLCGVQLGAAELALRQLSARTRSGTPLRYRDIEGPLDAAQHCQVLVLGQSDPASLRSWVEGLGVAPVLVVGLAPESLRAGASIALLTEPQGLAFSVNQSEARRRGLALSSQMLKLAREVR